MSGLVDQARLLLGYNEWANERVLAAADDLSPARFSEIQSIFSHMLGTQRWWFAKWAGAEYGNDLLPEGLEAMRAAYVTSHQDLRDFAEKLNDEELDRAERWWGNGDSLPIGDLVVQVVNHGTQHRAEIALAMSEHGSSPGDLDYLFFRLPKKA